MSDLDQSKQRQGGPDPEDEISIFRVLTILLSRRTLIVGVIVLSTGYSFVTASTKSTEFTSSAAFLAESSQGGGALSALGLAQQFGLAGGSSAGLRRPEFYADLITSDEVLRETVSVTYALSPNGEGPRETDLVTYYDSSGETESERIQRTIGALRLNIVVDTDRDTGVVSFAVTTSDAQLSQGIAQHILGVVDRFDSNTRQTQAGAERQFSGERLAVLTDELRAAEDSLLSFLTENRVFSNSPTLQVDYDRLQRVVVMRQDLVTSLAQAYERARIEEVRNTPVLTLVESPRVPPLRNPKRRVVTVLWGIVIGVVGGMGAAFLANAVEQERGTGSMDFEEFSTEWRQTLEDMRVLVRRPFGRSAEP